MTDENMRNWLVARRGDEHQVFARKQWEELGHDGWEAVEEHLTEEEAVKELTRLAPPEKRS